jgi:hypothetical protein
VLFLVGSGHACFRVVVGVLHSVRSGFACCQMVSGCTAVLHLVGSGHACFGVVSGCEALVLVGRVCLGTPCVGMLD